MARCKIGMQRQSVRKAILDFVFFLGDVKEKQRK